MIAVGLRARDSEGVHRLEVAVEARAVHIEADEVLGQLLVLAVLHHDRVPRRQPVEPSRGTRREVAVVRALVDVRKLLSRGHVDRRRIARQRDLRRQEGAIVRGVVPGEAALVEDFLPEDVVELHRLDGVLTVEHDGLAVLGDLHPAPHPHERITPVVRIVDRVAERLPERLALRLHRAPDLAELAPRLRILEARLLEPVLTIGHGPRDDELRHRHPAPVRRDGVGLGVVVPAALRAPDLLGHVGDVHQRALVEERVVVGDDDDVRAAAALDRRREARLDVVLVDPLDRDLGARLPAELLRLFFEHLVGRRNEVRPLQEVQARALRERGCGAGGGERPRGGGGSEKLASAEPGHRHRTSSSR